MLDSGHMGNMSRMFQMKRATRNVAARSENFMISNFAIDIHFGHIYRTSAYYMQVHNANIP